MAKIHTALTIAGTDPTGGAGIMADLKTFQARNVYGMAAITSVVAQNTMGVKDIQNINLDILEKQLNCIFNDIIPNATKTGMIATIEMMDVIKKYILANPQIPYIIDPVMVATSGDKLINDKAINHLKYELFPLAKIITPNLLETENIINKQIKTEDDIFKAGKDILVNFGPESVVIKGGHFGEDATDYLFTKDGKFSWSSKKFKTKHTHGTGCTFSAVITAELAKGKDIVNSVKIAKNFITSAIKNTPGLGHGCGPINHFSYREEL